MSVTSEVTVLAARFRQATAELKIPGGSRDGLREQLANAADPLDLSTYPGTIVSVGVDSVGGYHAGFSDSTTGIEYYSDWPQWAFGLAQAALLAGKGVQVTANGEPFGSNVLYLTMFS
jgi:hypothetical protein